MRRRALVGLLGLLLLGTAGCGHISSGAHAGEDGNSSCAVVCDGALGKSVLLHGSAPNGQQFSITGTVSGKTGAVRVQCDRFRIKNPGIFKTATGCVSKGHLAAVFDSCTQGTIAAACRLCQYTNRQNDQTCASTLV